MKEAAPRPEVPRVRRRGAAGAAWLSCFVAVFLLLGQASAVLHFELVQHRFCALHGIEEVHYVGVERGLDDAPRSMSIRGSAAREAPPVEVALDRCALAFLVHERFACLRAGEEHLPAQIAVRLAGPSREAVSIVGRPHLDFAPKIGPPA